MTSRHILERMQEKGVRQSTLRNGGIGFVVGSCFLALKFNKMRRNPKDFQTFKRKWYSYLMKFPIFLTTFTILYKGLRSMGRQLAGYRGLTEEGQRKVMRRTMLAITSFLCGYTAQMIAPVFNWNWALYAFFRSLLGMGRLLIPKEYQYESSNVYSVIHGILPWYITYNCCYISHSYASFFIAVLGQDQAPWTAAYGIGGGRGNHHHNILPSCQQCIHQSHDKSCLNAFIKDGIAQYKMCFTFYLKFYLVTSLLGGLKFFKNVLKHPDIVIPKLLSQTIRSSLFLFLSFHFPSRIHCLYQWLLKIYHRRFKNDKYSAIAPNNFSLMFTISMLFGGLCLKFELSKSKRTDIALFSFWRIVELAIYMKANVSTYEKDYDHYVLGSNQLPAILFALACAMAVYVHVTNPNALKSLEKSILKYTLA